MPNKLSASLIATAMGATAAAPVATVTSSAGFTLSGVAISTPAVSSWPLVVGDEVKDLSAPAVIRFADNTQIALAKGSNVRIEKDGNHVVVRLTAGDMTYKLGASPKVKVFALDRKLEKSQDGVSIRAQEVKVGEDQGPPPGIHPGPVPGKPPGRSQGE